jgi:Fur family ferric uptake transcriptional regulator
MISADEIVKKLKQRGERLTIQRRLVIETLCESGDHVTVHEVRQYLQQQGTDLNEPTVYRILQWLKELEVVSQTDLGQSGIVYQLIDDHPHHHLVCLACGEIMDVDDSVIAPLREHLRRAYDFEPRIDHMAIFGLCRNCQTTKTGDTSP